MELKILTYSTVDVSEVCESQAKVTSQQWLEIALQLKDNHIGVIAFQLLIDQLREVAK